MSGQLFEVPSGGTRGDEVALTVKERAACHVLLGALAAVDSRYWPDAAALAKDAVTLTDPQLDYKRLGFAAVALSRPDVRQLLDQRIAEEANRSPVGATL